MATGRKSNNTNRRKSKCNRAKIAVGGMYGGRKVHRKISSS